MADSTSPQRLPATVRMYERRPALALADVTPRVVLAFALLGASGAAIGLCAGLLTMRDPTPLLISNTATPVERGVMFAALAFGTLLFTLPAAAALLVRRWDAVDGICRAADRLAPLALAAFVPMLFAYRTWSQNRLTFLVLLAAVVLAAERLFARSFAAASQSAAAELTSLRLPTWARRHLPTLVVVAAAVGYTLYFSHYTLLHHRRFGTSGYDLGINVNWCFNALHGDFFRTTVLFGPDGGSMIAGHAIYAMFLWLPIFALHPGAEVLLVYQALAAGMAAIPLYLFARTQLPRWPAALIGVAYLFYAPLHGPNFYDYHELLVAMPWHFLLYWLIATNRLRWAWVTVIVIWAHREDLAVGLAVVGAFLLASGVRPRFGGALAVASTVWFVIDKFVIMPLAGSWWFASIYKDLAPAGEPGYGAIVQTILINPAYFLSTLLKEDKATYFLHLFAPLAFLPLRRPLLALLAIPGFFFTLMTTGYKPTISIAFQYTTHWIPYVFAATVIGLKLLAQTKGVARRRGAQCALALGVLSHSTVFGAVIQHDTFEGGFVQVEFAETPSDRIRYAGFRSLVAKIPPDASLAASEHEIAHVAARRNAYTLRTHHGDAEYLLIRKGGNWTKKVVQAAFDRNAYGLVDQFADTFYLFKKNHKSDQTRKALSQLGIKFKAQKHGS